MSSSAYIGIATIVYLAASAAHAVCALVGNRVLWMIAKGVTASAFVAHTAAITSRIIESGHAPLTNTYETLLVFSWILALLTLLLQSRPNIRLLGVFTCPLVFVALAATSLPQISSDIRPLLPSLRSNWLLGHVLTCFIAYATFAVAFASGLSYLILARLAKTPQRACTIQRLDNVTYRAITMGLPLLTMGVVTGAVWANACWGRYWSWDPKETWSLVTWLVYSAALHLRRVTGSRARWTAWASIVGFISILLTYLGVNYLFSSLHDYA